ncbi:hypothetical protein PUN28_018840 [Cardiocondyla obscurior]|uniref:Uncharacterized protein n=1 Tax=Cardiocondyla obscurior TaxID=286306 RepID=A0AAW2EF08_9HYME
MRNLRESRIRRREQSNFAIVVILVICLACRCFFFHRAKRILICGLFVTCVDRASAIAMILSTITLSKKQSTSGDTFTDERSDVKNTPRAFVTFPSRLVSPYFGHGKEEKKKKKKKKKTDTHYLHWICPRFENDSGIYDMTVYSV